MAERDASFRRPEPLARDMHEDGAAGTAAARAAVVIDDDNDIVLVIVAPEAFGSLWVGEANKAIVVAVVRCVAPSVLRPGCGKAQRCLRPAVGIGAEKTTFEAEDPSGRRVVALAFAARDAVSAQGARQGEVAAVQGSACAAR